MTAIQAPYALNPRLYDSANSLLELQAVIQSGNLDTLKTLLQAQTLPLNHPLPNGQFPLHFAVCENQPGAAKLLLDHGADLDFKDSQNLSAIDHAFLLQNPKIMAYLVETKYGEEMVDSPELKRLIEAGANERDPLMLTTSQLFMFASATMYWISNVALASKWLTEEQAKIAEWAAHLTTVLANYTHFHSYFKKAQLPPIMRNSRLNVIAQSPCFAFIRRSLDKSWHKVGAWAASIGCGVMPLVPLMTLGYTTWNTINIAKTAFSGLKASEENIKYRPLKAGRNIVVHVVNPAHSTYKVFEAYKNWQASIPQLVSWLTGS